MLPSSHFSSYCSSSGVKESSLKICNTASAHVSADLSFLWHFPDIRYQIGCVVYPRTIVKQQEGSKSKISTSSSIYPPTTTTTTPKYHPMQSPLNPRSENEVAETDSSSAPSKKLCSPSNNAKSLNNHKLNWFWPNDSLFLDDTAWLGSKPGGHTMATCWLLPSHALRLKEAVGPSLEQPAFKDFFYIRRLTFVIQRLT